MLDIMTLVSPATNIGSDRIFQGNVIYIHYENERS